MSLLDDTYIAQRNAGEQAVIANLESMGLIKKPELNEVELQKLIVDAARELVTFALDHGFHISVSPCLSLGEAEGYEVCTYPKNVEIEP